MFACRTDRTEKALKDSSVPNLAGNRAEPCGTGSTGNRQPAVWVWPGLNHFAHACFGVSPSRFFSPATLPGTNVAVAETAIGAQGSLHGLAGRQ